MRDQVTILLLVEGPEGEGILSVILHLLHLIAAAWVYLHIYMICFIIRMRALPAFLGEHFSI